MKILFCTTMDLQIQTFHWRTIKALHNMGHTVDAVTNGTYTIDEISHKYTVPFNRNPLHPDNLRALSMLKKILRENQYDIISCHSPVADFFGRMAARGMKIKVLYTAHGFHFWKGAPLVNQLAYKNMEKLAAHWTDVLMTINPEDYEAAQKFSYKPSGGPVYIPGVGVDVKAIQAAKEDKALIRKELGIPENSFVLYSIGELIPRQSGSEAPLLHCRQRKADRGTDGIYQRTRTGRADPSAWLPQGRKKTDVRHGPVSLSVLSGRTACRSHGGYGGRTAGHCDRYPRQPRFDPAWVQRNVISGG